MFKKIQNKTKVGALLFMAMALAGVYNTIPFSSFEAANAAGAASVSLSPTTQSVKVNDSFTVTVAVNPAGEAIIGAQVKLSYDATKLQYVSHTENTSPLDTSLASSVTTGAMDMTRVTFGTAPTASFTFMQITFKAIATGSPTVKVLSGTETTRASDGSSSWNGVQTTATYTVSANTPTPTPTPTPSPSPTPSPTPTPTPSPSPTPSPTPPTPTPTPSPSPTPSPTPTPTPSPSPTPSPTPPTPPEDLIVSQPSVKNNSFKKVVIAMQTTRPVKAKVLYGLDGTLALSSSETDFSTTPSVELDARMLVPGRTYSYAMVLSEQDGTMSQSSTQTFISKGYRLKLRILYRDGKPCKNKAIKLNSEPREGTTDDNGEVVFEDVESGDHTVSFDVAGVSVSQPVSVAANEVVAAAAEDTDIPLQSFELQVSQLGDSGNRLPMLMGGIVSALLLAGIGFVLIKQRLLPAMRTAHIANANISGSAQSYNPASSGSAVEDDDYLRPNPPAVSSVVHPEQHTQSVDGDAHETPKK